MPLGTRYCARFVNDALRVMVTPHGASSVPGFFILHGLSPPPPPPRRTSLAHFALPWVTSTCPKWQVAGPVIAPWRIGAWPISHIGSYFNSHLHTRTFRALLPPTLLLKIVEKALVLSAPHSGGVLTRASLTRRASVERSFSQRLSSLSQATRTCPDGIQVRPRHTFVVGKRSSHAA